MFHGATYAACRALMQNECEGSMGDSALRNAHADRTVVPGTEVLVLVLHRGANSQHITLVLLYEACCFYLSI